MKSTLDTLDGLNRKLNIEIPAEKVNDTLDKLYKGIQKNATIKGFRKGKAPLGTIKSMYRDRVMQDALQRLVSESYQKALDEHALDPVTQPQIDIVSFTEQQPFSYTAELEVRPEINLRKIEGLVVEKERLEIPEQKITDVLENIRNSYHDLNPVLENRPAQIGDVALIDFEGFVDGKPLEGGKASNHQLEIGSKSFIEGFEEGIVGMAVNSEKTLDVKFPDDYHVAELKSKPVSFKVKLTELKKKVLPDLNDDLAKKVSDKFATLEDLKKAIREDMEKNETKRIDEDLKNRLLKILVKENPVEVPAALKEEQKSRLMEDVDTRLKKQGLQEPQIAEYKDKWKDDFEKSAAFMVQSSFLIDAIANKFDLRANSKDIENKLTEMAAELKVDKEMIKSYYKDQNRESTLRFQIMEEKVVAHLLATAKVTEIDKEKLAEE